MGPSYATVIVPIAKGQEKALRDFIVTHVDPQPGAGGTLDCQPQFPFDRVPQLHFMSFLVLEPDLEESLPAQLVLDATFDDDRAAFLRALLAQAGAGLREIYSHCVGSTLESDEAFIGYLVAHDVGADTYFNGAFGRTVLQVKQEHQLRGALQGELDAQRASPLPRPPTNEGLLAALRTFVAASGFSWASPAPAVPFLMRHQQAVGVALLAAVAGVLGLVGGLILWLFGQTPADLYDAVLAAPAWVLQLGWSYPLLSGVLLLAVLVVGLRWVALVGAAAASSPKPQLPLLDAAGFLALPLFAAAIAAYAIDLGLIAAELVRPDVLALPDEARNEAAWLGATLLGSAPHTLWRGLALGSVCLIALALLAYVDTGRAMALARMPRRNRMQQTLLRTVLAVAEAAVIALLVVAVLVAIAAIFPGLIASLIEGVVELLAAAGVVVVCMLAGAALLYALVFLFLIVVAVHEKKDISTYLRASALTRGRTGNQQARAREEGGTNALQNHLASLTYVKPGRFRLYALKATLALIGFLARVWYNQGNLGGIPTILSARWVVIDKGRRLIFLDNYGGGWESYLNEFIDMSAVLGLNAIWTNTYIKWPTPGSGDGKTQRYAFPDTRFYTTGGARDERPFKAYVRYSQIETLAWYGAYHRQSIVNINANSAIRRDLFKPLQSHEVDRLVGKL